MRGWHPTPPRQLARMLPRRDWGLIAMATLAAGLLPGVGVSLAETAALMALAGACMAIALFDLRHRIIPDALSLPLLALGLGLCAALRPEALVPRLIALAVAVAILLALRALHTRLRRRVGLGLGDVKLVAVAAVWLAPAALPDLVLAAALSGLLHAGLARVFDPDAPRAIPFGMHLAGWLCLIAAAEAAGLTLSAL